MVSIRLSDKHGVNSCVPICFWCRGDQGTVALLGKLKGDAKAPMRPFVNYNPCAKCAANYALGVVVIEALDEDPGTGLPPIREKPEALWPTGTWCVLAREAAERIIGPAAAGGRLFVCPQAYDGWGLRDAEAAE